MSLEKVKSSFREMNGHIPKLTLKSKGMKLVAPCRFVAMTVCRI